MDFFKKHLFYSGLLVGAAFAAIFTFFLLKFGLKYQKSTNSDPVVRIGIQQSDYEYLSPLLAYDSNPEQGFTDLKNFQKSLQATVDQLEGTNGPKFISLYFRDLSNGHWLDINPQNKFYPASLLKVPLMMAIFKQSEKTPGLLKQKLIMNENSEDANIAEVFKPKNPIKPGQAYSVEDLIEKMIVESDNNAANLLTLYLDQINPTAFEKIYQDFGIYLPDPAHSDEDFINPHNYALFLRVLRNATYLGPEYSEMALKYLSEDTFNEGIAAGLPENVTLTNKFGEALSPETQPDGSHLKELHDCGIVYLSGHNYLLCIMTKGQDFPNLTNDIKTISQFVYGQVSTNYK